MTWVIWTYSIDIGRTLRVLTTIAENTSARDHKYACIGYVVALKIFTVTALCTACLFSPPNKIQKAKEVEKARTGVILTHQAYSEAATHTSRV